jgi:cytoskeletal protein CcmA (bactofilin family)
MAEATVIGAGTRIRGRIHGDGDLVVDGFVEGDVKVNGEVQIGASGLVAASIEGARISVRGAVRGDLSATVSIHLEEGARVVGAIRAPRVSVASGALYRGVLHTAAPGEVVPVIAGSTPVQAAKPQAAPARPAPAVAPKAFVAPPAPVRPAAAVAVAVAAPPPPPASAPAIDDVAESDVDGENDGTMPAMRRGARGQVAKKKN